MSSKITRLCGTPILQPKDQATTFIATHGGKVGGQEYLAAGSVALEAETALKKAGLQLNYR